MKHQREESRSSQAIASWGAAHPEATLAEIEAAVDEQLKRLRARLIEEVAQASPLERAASEVQAMLGVQVSDSTVRRQALAAGAIWEHIQAEQAQPAGSKHFPLPQEEPTEGMVMSSDGGLVPLRGGLRAEVKTLVKCQQSGDASSSQRSRYALAAQQC